MCLPEPRIHVVGFDFGRHFGNLLKDHFLTLATQGQGQRVATPISKILTSHRNASLDG